MCATVSEIVQVITAEIPEYAAEDWDNVGLQVGNLNMSVNSVLVCLEVCDPIIDEAIEKRCNMIIAHHPLIFRPLKTMAETDPKARLLSRLIKADIALYVMHTNYDHYDNLDSRQLITILAVLRQAHRRFYTAYLIFRQRAAHALDAQTVQ